MTKMSTRQAGIEPATYGLEGRISGFAGHSISRDLTPCLVPSGGRGSSRDFIANHPVSGVQPVRQPPPGRRRRCP